MAVCLHPEGLFTFGLSMMGVTVRSLSVYKKDLMQAFMSVCSSTITLDSYGAYKQNTPFIYLTLVSKLQQNLYYCEQSFQAD